MSTDDNIFLATNRPLRGVATWLEETLGLEPVEISDAEEGVYRFSADARTVQGDIYLTIEPHVYGEIDPEQEDVSAIDRYQGVVDVYYAGRRARNCRSRRRGSFSTTSLEHNPTSR